MNFIKKIGNPPNKKPDDPPPPTIINGKSLLTDGEIREIFNLWRHLQETPAGLYARFKKAESDKIGSVTLSKLTVDITANDLGFKIVGFQRKTVEHGWVEVFAEDIKHYESRGQTIRPVYAPAEYVEAPPVEAQSQLYECKACGGVITKIQRLGNACPHCRGRFKDIVIEPKL